MNKKVFFITGIIALLAIGTGVWYFLLRPTSPGPVVIGPSASPFGQGGGDITHSINPDGTTGTTGVGTTGKPVARLFRIVDTPIAGAVGIIKNNQTAIRYVDRATGHIFDVDPVTLLKTQITNDTLPKIYEAVFKSDGSAVILRSLHNDGDTVDNLSLTLTPPKATTTDTLYTVTETPLRGNIDQLIIRDSSLIYNFKDSGAIVSSNLDGSKPVTIFNSAFNDWALLLVGTNILVTTKPSVQAAGFAYTLAAKNTTLSKLFGPLAALAVTSNTAGTKLVYSFNSGVPTLATTDLQTKASVNLIPATLADKCVWDNKQKMMLLCGVPTNIDSDEPDAWYQGKIHFSDRIWRFNTDTSFTDTLVDPKKDFNTDIDVMNPMLTPDEDYLLFTNKNDLTLWALKLQ